MAHIGARGGDRQLVQCGYFNTNVHVSFDMHICDFRYRMSFRSSDKGMHKGVLGRWQKGCARVLPGLQIS
jgi:hypothetical protein